MQRTWGSPGWPSNIRTLRSASTPCNQRVHHHLWQRRDGLKLLFSRYSAPIDPLSPENRLKNPCSWNCRKIQHCSIKLNLNWFQGVNHGPSQHWCGLVETAGTGDSSVPYEMEEEEITGAEIEE